MPITKINSLGITYPVSFSAGTVSLPSITFSGDTNTGVFSPTADTIAFTEGGSEAMRIDSSGNVGIGTTTVNSSGSTKSVSLNAAGMTSYELRVSDVFSGYVGNNGTDMYLVNAKNGFLGLYTNNTERMRVTSGGDVGIGTTAPGTKLSVTRDGGPPLFIDRLTNDGILIEFYQASVAEGNISVAGNTVSYNGFTGSHWSRFIDDSKPDVLRGTVLESLDQMIDWYHVEFTDNKNNLQKKPYALKANEKEGDVITYAWKKKDEEGNDIIEQVQATIVKEVDVKHVMSKISDTVEAKNVYGVFSAWDNDDLINNDFYVASVGSFVVRIKAGQIVSKGDLLQSNGDGTAKVQADDIIRASTFAKVLSNTVIETYEDGSFIVPCSLMC